MLRVKDFLRRSRQRENDVVEEVFNQYSNDMPSHQTAIDALPGWTSAFPAVAKVNAGDHPLFADTRISWALSKAGSIADKKILEIGPLEGMHTYMLNKQRPSFIDAVEANKQCFLRCLVTKEILGIDRARFHLGDAQKWLKENDQHYDLAIASGVLYHMADPGEFLCRLAQRCDNLFIWTHYFDDSAMPEGDKRRLAFTGEAQTRTLAGTPLRYYERRYFKANTNTNFCGGMKDRHFWMHRDDIISLLKAVGFNDVAVTQETPDHSGGPCYSLFATRNPIAQKA